MYPQPTITINKIKKEEPRNNSKNSLIKYLKPLLLCHYEATTLSRSLKDLRFTWPLFHHF
jgi:hypothetical protein